MSLKSGFHSSRVAGAILMLATVPVTAHAKSDLVETVRRDHQTVLAGIYDDLHRNPELSFNEVRTAAIVAENLRDLGIEVTEKVGQTGVVGVLRNGAGPTIMIRADMDALPVEERSGVANASKVRAKDSDGNIVSVSHACGHDVHVTALIGTARRLTAMRDRWRGTIVFVAQPAEEILGGAQAMIDDGLFSRFPKPEYAVAFHVSSRLPVGTISATETVQAASSDAIEIVVRGEGGHGGSPHLAKNPIMIGTQIISMLQMIVAQERPPLVPAVLSIGAFQSGSRNNVIPETATIRLSMRTNDPATRARSIASIKRIAENVARAAGMPDDALPTVRITAGTPPTINDRQLAIRLNAVMQRTFGPSAFIPFQQQSMGAEDFALFANPGTSVRGYYFHVGGTPQSDHDRASKGGTPVPAHHSPYFKLDAQSAVINGTVALTAAALDLLPRGT